MTAERALAQHLMRPARKPLSRKEAKQILAYLENTSPQAIRIQKLQAYLKTFYYVEFTVNGWPHTRYISEITRRVLREGLAS